MTQPPLFKPCAVIPVYNHGRTAGRVAASLARHHLPVILVDDGSDAETKTALAAVVRDVPGCVLHTLPENTGKGGAVSHGLIKAFEAGFSHALQVDADGQHNLEPVDLFLREAGKDPDALIGGRPIYDESVPKGRKIGRGITNFWVTIETLSRDIPDAMCGFRVYPLAPCHRLLTTRRLRRRMEFDIEILVRLHWRGVRMRFLPVPVTYPPDGLSHFRMFRDNLAISLMHTRLFFGMIFRFPVIIFRRLKRLRLGRKRHGALG